MKRLLISPEEVLEIAFGTPEGLRPELVGDVRIETAQLKYLKPVFGALYDRLGEEAYAPFVTDYLKLPLALYIKALTIDNAAVTIGAMGVTQTETGYAVPGSPGQLARLRQQTRTEADILLRKAVEEVERHPERFPGYDPRENILNRISCRGGVAL